MASNQTDLSFTASNQVVTSFVDLVSSLGRLSSGHRIISAADDPSGLAISHLLRADLTTARQGVRNASDGISMLQTADGAADVINRNLIRMKELATQASSPAYSTAQKKLIQSEFDHMAAENARIAADTRFNGTPLFADGEIPIVLGDGSSITLQTQSLDMPPANLIANPLAAALAVDAAIQQTTTYRASIGSAIQQLESASDVLFIRAENLLASKSRILDADIAFEVAALTIRKVQTIAASSCQVHAGEIAKTMQLVIG